MGIIRKHTTKLEKTIAQLHKKNNLLWKQEANETNLREKYYPLWKQEVNTTLLKTTNQKKFNWLRISDNYLKVFFFQNVKIYRIQRENLTIQQSVNFR